MPRPAFNQGNTKLMVFQSPYRSNSSIKSKTEQNYDAGDPFFVSTLVLTKIASPFLTCDQAFISLKIKESGKGKGTFPASANFHSLKERAPDHWLLLTGLLDNNNYNNYYY